ncbi:MAG: TlpA family protein disulfide reductase [Bacteroidetes bacterium]|nr:TlpA family protein disulfide reductase [Bacteroidota bacterium]
MKILVVLFLIFTLIIPASKAQHIVRQFKQGSKTVYLTENTTVKDSVGNPYSFNEWPKLLISGEYVLKPVGTLTDTSQFILYHIISEHKDSVLAQMPKPRESAFFKTGKPITSFTDHDINGHKIKLTDLRGNVVVIYFWDIRSQTADQIGELNKLTTDYRQNLNIKFIAVGMSYKHDILTFLEGNPFDFDIIPDGFYTSLQYNINLLPTIVVVDKQGVVRFHTSGYRVNNIYWVKKTIEEIK